MALCPFARKQLLPENSSQPRIKPTTHIMHSAVSNAKSLYGYFSSPGVNLESHFYIAEDGELIQMIDTEVRADANYRANGFAVSTETWDGGNPDKTPWNPKQVATLIRLNQWLNATHGIPMRRTTGWNTPGVGGHSDYPGVWTPVRGKTCPGLARRPQVNQIIAAAAKGGTATTTAPEDDLPYSEADLIRIVKKAVWDSAPSGQKTSAGNLLVNTEDRARRYLDASVSAVGAALGQLSVTADVDAKAIAAEIAKALPATSAKQVADEIHRRLAS